MQNRLATALRRIQVLSALRHGDYRLFWLAMALSTAGQTLWRGTQGWLIVTLTNSAFLLGLAGFMSMIPSLGLSLFAGVISDRTDKRLILLMTQVGFGIGVLLLGILIGARVIDIWHVMVVALVVGVNIAFFFPSRQAKVPEMLPEKHVPNGIALNSSGFYIAIIASSATLGWLIQHMGMDGSSYIAVLFFVAAFLFLLRLRHRSPKPDQTSRRHLWRDLAQSFRYARNNRLVLILLAITAAMSLLRGSPLTLMPIFAKDVLGVGATGLGYLLAANSVGALVGTIVLASIGNYRAKGVLILAAFFIEGLSQALFAFSRVMPLSMAALAMHGAASAISITALITVLQLATPNDFRGRIMGLYFLVFQGLIPIGALLSGTLASFTSAPSATVVTGISMGIVTLGFTLAAPVLRKAS